MIVVAHNLAAMNAQRQFNITDKKKAKNVEKLSSGYKINRSADDAAGLSISEKMRNQIRNLTQGINNTEDGIALIKTAEQALQESQNILKRMHELAVQAANDVNSIEDRQAIQYEIDSLYGEIDDIANKTQFNGKFPLRGDKININEISGIGLVNSSKADYFINNIRENIILTNGQIPNYKFGGVQYTDQYGGALVIDTLEEQTIFINDPSSSYPEWWDGGAGNSSTWNRNNGYALHISDLHTDSDGKVYYNSRRFNRVTYLTLDDDNKAGYTFNSSDDNIIQLETVNSSVVNPNSKQYQLPDYLENYTYNVTATSDLTFNGTHYSAGDSISVNIITKDKDNSFCYNMLFNWGDGFSGGESVINSVPPDGSYSLSLSDLKIDEYGDVYFYSKINGQQKYLNYDTNGAYEYSSTNWVPSWVLGVEKTNSSDNNSSNSNIDNNSLDTNESLWIQSGANAGEGMFISTVDATALGIGLNRVNVLSHQSASNSMEKIDNALKKVSEYRSQFGAQQNRLEYTIEHELNYSENLQNAESNLRDTDMAKEMVDMSKNDILQQAAQSMLAHANQQNQGILQLIQS